MTEIDTQNEVMEQTHNTNTDFRHDALMETAAKVFGPYIAAATDRGALYSRAEQLSGLSESGNITAEHLREEVLRSGAWLLHLLISARLSAQYGDPTYRGVGRIRGRLRGLLQVLGHKIEG